MISKFRSAVTWIVGINIFIFLLQQVLGEWFTASFMLIGKDIFIRPWILITSMFLHSGPMHLLFNMYVLYMFGMLIEQRIGTKRFLLIYFLSGIFAGFISSFFYQAALGASGAIMGVLGVVIVLMPDLRVLLFFIIPMTLRQAAILIAFVEAVMIFVPTGIANIAHLSGMALGIAYGVYLNGKRKNYQGKFKSKIHLNESDIKEYMRSGRI